MKEPYFSVGLHKGEMDFGVSGTVADLSYEQMRQLREMIVVGIGTCESMWRAAQQRKNAASQASPETPRNGEK